jgi:hypothetical protein
MCHFLKKIIMFLPLIEILTKIINHINKETVYNPLTGIQGVFEVEAFLLTCDSMRCSKEF